METKIEPTPEQRDVIALFATEEGIAVQAGAGTGKTTTLVELANSTDRIGYYLAFNRDIVQDSSKRMPDTVICSTAHSLAMRAVGHHYRHRIDGGRMKGWELARRLDIPPLPLVVGGIKRKVVTSEYLAGLVMRAMRIFCFTADDQPTTRHVPYVEGIDLPDPMLRRTYANNELVRAHVEPYLALAWTDLLNPNGQLPYTHDHYLKAWQLSEPRIPGEFILFDEAQDASPVMLAAIAAQNAQLVYVGDAQQQIYEWRGAVNALANVDAQHTAFLTQSFRFGPAIADVANVVLSKLNAQLRLVGTASIESTVDVLELPDCVLCRTNGGAMERVLQYGKQGRRVHLVGGGGEVAAFVRGALSLQQGRRTGHPDLACFESWGEVVAYVQDDPQGDELATMVKLVESYGAEDIMAALDNMPLERAAEVVVSTAHKAKGREWDTVQLAGDFLLDDLPPEEWRLIYVAATRARHVLDLSRCYALRGAVNVERRMRDEPKADV